MEAILVSQGWPNVPNPDQLVFDNLHNMWEALSRAGLLKSNWNYDDFVHVAQHEYQLSRMRNFFRG